MAAYQALQMNVIDNVATVLADVPAGMVVLIRGEETGAREVESVEFIPSGHKISLCGIGRGEVVIKYGYPVGKATRDIRVGEHAHVHNVESSRGRGDKVQIQ